MADVGITSADYIECPFCPLIFEDPFAWPTFKPKPLDAHIMSDHHKVRVRKGSNYRWVDRDEVARRVKETERIMAKGKR